MSYRVLVSPEMKKFVEQLDSKSYRIITNGLKKRGENPYPGEGLGDKEKLPIRGKKRYRLDIGRTCTVFSIQFRKTGTTFESPRFYRLTKPTRNTDTSSTPSSHENDIRSLTSSSAACYQYKSHRSTKITHLGHLLDWC